MNDEEMAQQLRDRGWVVFRRPSLPRPGYQPVMRSCSACQREFIVASPADKGRIYCSTRCRNRATYERRKARKENMKFKRNPYDP